MPQEIHSVVHATQAWLLSTWHVQVPFAWLEACVEWLQGEAGVANHLSQQQINQQVLDQWLLTDLRDLDYPVLPEGLAQAQKTELHGSFCVQVDSLLDISQPAYGQLQKWRGTDCSNDEVSAITQTTQRPWEEKSNRMLLLQVTDGVQSLEAMEYQSVPALSATLRPGAKLQLQGQMVCRLGVLLLGPANVKVLGGEVEDLVERNKQGKVLCRTLGLPEEEQQEEEEEGTEGPTPQQQGNQEMEILEVDDEELLASLEEQGEARPTRDSGYETLQETLTLSSRSSFARSLVSSRGETSTSSYRSGLTQNSRVGSVQVHPSNDQENYVTGDEFPDEDFDDLPLDELDSVILQENENVMTHRDNSHRSTLQNDIRSTGNPGALKGAVKPQSARFEPHDSCGSGTLKRDHHGCIRKPSSLINTATSKPFPSSAVSEPSHDLQLATNDENDFMDEDMDCLFQEMEVSAETTRAVAPLSAEEQPQRDSKSISGSSLFSKSTKTVTSPPEGVTLTSAPFTYLCLLEDLKPKPPHSIQIHIKAFIVTLMGKLSSSNGVWSICATVSDGTGYLDVELSNEVLTDLLGFSVAEKATLKRDPACRGKLDSGMRRCQEQLVDMCCIMTIVVDPENGRAVVVKAEPVSERVFQELEQRRRKWTHGEAVSRSAVMEKLPVMEKLYHP